MEDKVQQYALLAAKSSLILVLLAANISTCTRLSKRTDFWSEDIQKEYRATYIQIENLASEFSVNNVVMCDMLQDPNIEHSEIPISINEEVEDILNKLLSELRTNIK